MGHIVVLDKATSGKIAYWTKGGEKANFGDVLTELLVSDLFVKPRVHADRYHIIGSVLWDRVVQQDAEELGTERPAICFWACGVRDPDSTSRIASDPLINVLGARGPLTVRALGMPADTPIGDPGLLLPLLHPAPIFSSPRIICVPHAYDERSDAEVLAISGAAAVVRPWIAPTRGALHTILDQIASADFVLAGALHAAIAAAAYRRPFAFWDGGLVDVPFKWQDFAASIGMECIFARNVSEGWEAHELTTKQLRFPPLDVLLACCPFSVEPRILRLALLQNRFA